MSKLGWSWNRKPSGGRTIFTAEFVESFVIFLYGSTNTWMERWGKSGAYSVKDAQHISIAVMYAFESLRFALIGTDRLDEQVLGCWSTWYAT